MCSPRRASAASAAARCIWASSSALDSVNATASALATRNASCSCSTLACKSACATLDSSRITCVSSCFAVSSTRATSDSSLAIHAAFFSSSIIVCILACVTFASSRVWSNPDCSSLLCSAVSVHFVRAEARLAVISANSVTLAFSIARTASISFSATCVAPSCSSSQTFSSLMVSAEVRNSSWLTDHACCNSSRSLVRTLHSSCAVVSVATRNCWRLSRSDNSPSFMRVAFDCSSTVHLSSSITIHTAPNSSLAAFTASCNVSRSLRSTANSSCHSEMECCAASRFAARVDSSCDCSSSACRVTPSSAFAARVSSSSTASCASRANFTSSASDLTVASSNCSSSRATIP